MGVPVCGAFAGCFVRTAIPPPSQTLQRWHLAARNLGLSSPPGDAASHPQAPVSALGKGSCWETPGPRCVPSPACRQAERSAGSVGVWGGLRAEQAAPASAEAPERHGRDSLPPQLQTHP